MTFINQVVANIAGGSTWWYIKEIMKSAGWTVKSSGDGLALFSSTTDIITLPGTGAGGMNNTNAWFRIQMPLVDGVRRELVMQRAASSPQGTIKYSFSANFSGGAPSSTVTPTATDQAIITSTPSQSIWAGDNGFHLYLGANNSDGYEVFAGVQLNGNLGSNNSGGFLLDRMLPGSGPAGDPDPYILYSETTSSGSFNVGKITVVNNPGTGSLGQAWMHKGLPTEVFAGVGGMTVGSIFANTPGAGTNIYDKRESLGPIVWVRHSAATAGPAGLKGVGTIMRWIGAPKAGAQTLSVLTPNDRIVVADVSFPWDGTKPGL